MRFGKGKGDKGTKSSQKFDDRVIDARPGPEEPFVGTGRGPNTRRSTSGRRKPGKIPPVESNASGPDISTAWPSLFKI